jgi:hypothetical protein
MATSRPRRNKDTEEVVRGVRRQIRSLEKRAADEDPWVVDDMLKLRDELDAAAVRTVGVLRDKGYTWKDIGFSLGIGAITCHKRYAHRIGDAS